MPSSTSQNMPQSRSFDNWSRIACIERSPIASSSDRRIRDLPDDLLGLLEVADAYVPADVVLMDQIGDVAGIRTKQEYRSPDSHRPVDLAWMNHADHVVPDTDEMDIGRRQREAEILDRLMGRLIMFLRSWVAIASSTSFLRTPPPTKKNTIFGSSLKVTAASRNVFNGRPIA